MALTDVLYTYDHPFSTSGQEKDKQRVSGTFVGPASYATGGESLTARDIGMNSIDFITFEIFEDASNTYVLRYDRTNALVIINNDEAGTEETNTTDLSSNTYRFRAVGQPTIISTAT